jgi:hypothetical protein
MKNSFYFSLATAFVALALFVLISCGTMGDGGGNGGNPSSNSGGNWSPTYCDYGPITQYNMAVVVLKWKTRTTAMNMVR